MLRCSGFDNEKFPGDFRFTDSVQMLTRGVQMLGG